MESEEREREGRGRSAKKRAAQAVEDLARQMVELPEAEAARLPASPAIMAELRQARQTREHGARRRQVKYLAGLLRRDEEEAEAIRSFLDGVHSLHLEESRELHRLEDLRNRLVDPDAAAGALGEAKESFPSLDTEEIVRLAGICRTTGDRRAVREIFRRLREALEKTKNG